MHVVYADPLGFLLGTWDLGVGARQRALGDLNQHPRC